MKKVGTKPQKICLMHHNYDWKGYNNGIKAICQSFKHNPNFELVVFGEKLKEPNLLHQDIEFDFEYFYRPTGDVIRNLFFDCDIYLCPSWHEGLGMPAMRAIAARCALVTTDTGGSRSYAVQGKTAMVSPPKNTEALSKNITKLIENIKLKKHFRKIDIIKLSNLVGIKIANS